MSGIPRHPTGSRRRTALLVAALAALAAALGAGPAWAADIHVTTTDDIVADDGLCSLREAVTASNDNVATTGCPAGQTSVDGIYLPAGTYGLTLAPANEDANAGGDLDINGGIGGVVILGAGAESTIIDSNGPAPGNDRLLHVLGGQVNVQGVTLTDGNAFLGGGAVLTQGNAQFLLASSRVTENHGVSQTGGGLHLGGSGGATVLGSEITENTLNGNAGAGIAATAGANLTITNTTISANEATSAAGSVLGGGVSFQPAGEAGSLTITGSTIAGNLASSGASIPWGGGLYIGPAQAALVESTVIHGNEARIPTSDNAFALRGGGAYVNVNTGNTARFVDSVISGNVATNSSETATVGGGLLHASGTARLTGTTVAGNTLVGGSSQQGAGIRSFNPLRVLNSTISGNALDDAVTPTTGGGITTGGSPTLIVHSTLAGNHAGGGAGDELERAGGGAVTVRGSVIDSANANNACSGNALTSGGYNVAVGTSCVLTATGDEQNANPMLGPLFDNGGPRAGREGLEVPVRTHAPALPSTVVDHVPEANCLDAEDAPDPLIFDQRGFPRPFDGGASADCDAGAVEVIPCAGQGARAVGTDGDDVINGTGGTDVIHGLDGDDEINGLGGNDRLCGGEGDDVLTGGPGADIVLAGPGADSLFLRDGTPDSGDCGLDADPDFVQADAQGVDTLPNCAPPDTIEFLAVPATAGSTVNRAAFSACLRRAKAARRRAVRRANRLAGPAKRRAKRRAATRHRRAVRRCRARFL